MYLGVFEDLQKHSQMEKERFSLIYQETVDPRVEEYLVDCFAQLTIHLGKEGSLFDFMNQNLLIRWCYETTSTAIVFLKEEDSIERGTLVLEPGTTYPHSWICFTFEGVEYVFDPCLSVLCRKELYSTVFESNVVSSLSSKRVERYLIDCLSHPKPTTILKTGDRNRDFANAHFNQVLERYAGSILEKTRKEVLVQGTGEIADPFYIGNIGYIGTVENQKIKKLYAHFYDCEG